MAELGSSCRPSGPQDGRILFRKRPEAPSAVEFEKTNLYLKGLTVPGAVDHSLDGAMRVGRCWATEGGREGGVSSHWKLGLAERPQPMWLHR